MDRSNDRMIHQLIVRCVDCDRVDGGPWDPNLANVLDSELLLESQPWPIEGSIERSIVESIGKKVDPTCFEHDPKTVKLIRNVPKHPEMVLKNSKNNLKTI